MKATTTTEKVSKEIAEKEVTAWLESQHVTIEQSKIMLGAFNKMVAGVMNGILTIDESTREIKQRLIYPVGVEAKINDLSYRTNITTGEIELKSEQIEKFPGANNDHAWCGAMTGTELSVITRMHVKDWNYAHAIVLFFMI